MTATLSEGSLSNQWNRACSCQCNLDGIEFRCAGRLIVTSRMPDAGKVAEAPSRVGNFDVGLFDIFIQVYLEAE